MYNHNVHGEGGRRMPLSRQAASFTRSTSNNNKNNNNNNSNNNINMCIYIYIYYVRATQFPHRAVP